MLIFVALGDQRHIVKVFVSSLRRNLENFKQTRRNDGTLRLFCIYHSDIYGQVLGYCFCLFAGIPEPLLR